MGFVRLQSYYNPYLVLLTNCRYVVIPSSGFHGAYSRGVFRLIHALGVIFCEVGLEALLRCRAFRVTAIHRVADYAIDCDSFDW